MLSTKQAQDGTTAVKEFLKVTEGARVIVKDASKRSPVGMRV
jgi:hypothetical protein